MSSNSRAASARVERKRARVRARIIEATAELVRRDGIPTLTMEAVAAAADISKPSLYYYFTSKEELARALAIEGSRAEVARVCDAIEAADANTTVVERVVRAYVTHHSMSLHLFRAQYVWVQVIGIEAAEVDGSVNPDMNRMFDLFEQRIRDDAACGLVRAGVDPRRAAVSTWASAYGLVSMIALLDVSGTRLLHAADDLVDELCKNLARGIYQ